MRSARILPASARAALEVSTPSAAAARATADGQRGSSAAAQVESFIRELMGRANEEKSPAGWLRVAKWKAWNGDKASAVTFATKAADLEPKNPAPRSPPVWPPSNPQRGICLHS